MSDLLAILHRHRVTVDDFKAVVDERDQRSTPISSYGLLKSIAEQCLPRDTSPAGRITPDQQRDLELMRAVRGRGASKTK